jgi:cytochrome c oxidase subunit 3
MTAPLRKRIVGDVSSLPDGAMGAANVVWWGNLGFMLIEGTAFALAIGAYFYLQSQSAGWPPRGDAPPDLFWGSIFTAAMLASELPNRWVSARARAKDARGRAERHAGDGADRPGAARHPRLRARASQHSLGS